MTLVATVVDSTDDRFFSIQKFLLEGTDQSIRTIEKFFGHVFCLSVYAYAIFLKFSYDFILSFCLSV